jgi:RNA polymerase-binding transcription factor DksA
MATKKGSPNKAAKAAKSAKPARPSGGKATATKPAAKKAAVKAAPKKAAPAPKKAAAKAAPARKEVKPAKPLKKAPAPAPAKKAAPAKPVASRPVASKAPASKAPVSKAPARPAPVKAAPAKAAPQKAAAAPAAEPVKKPAVEAPTREEVKPAIKPIETPVVKPEKKEPPKPVKVVIPKTSTTKAVKYEPDFTRSVLDSPQHHENTGPTMRYSDSELTEFRELIQKKLDTAKKELAYLQGLITRKDEGDMEDGRYMTMEDGSMSMEREQLSQMASRQIQFIDHLEKALMRIESKTYGICRVTGKLIDKARLRAVPHATLSIEAKQMMNK